MRKNHLRTAVLVLLLLSLLSASAFAEQAVVTGSGVNMRSGPGTGYGVITTLGRDTVIEVIDTSNASWYQVRWGDEVGYMSSSYLRLQESSSAVVTSDSTPQQAQNSASGEEAVVVIIDGQPVRSSPAPAPTPHSVQVNPTPTPVATTTPVATPTPSTAAITTLTPASVATPTPIVPPSPKPTATPVPIIIVGPNGSVLVTPAPGTTPAATLAFAEESGSQEEEESAASQDGKAGQIIGNSVRFRSGPGTTYAILDAYDKGTALRILGRSGDWTLVTIGNVSGYVFSDYVTEIEANTSAPSPTPSPSTAVSAAAASGVSEMTLGLSGTASAILAPSAAVQDGYINANNVRMREGPSMTSGILAELNYGSMLKITGSSSGWYQVICGGHTGFVYGDYVTVGVYAPASAVTASTGAQLGKEIASYALNFVGYRYTWGGKAPETGFDCSGFVQYIFSQFGYTTSRVANDVLGDGVHVDPGNIQPGDVLCFWTGSGYCGHVGIYIGDNRFVHAANSATGVVTTSLSEGYYASRGYEIRRII